MLVVAACVPWGGDGSVRAEPRSEPATPLLSGLVRSGRPAAVRAPGVARVRGARGPWCTPVRPGSAEFLLPEAPLPGEALELDRGGRIDVVRPDWRSHDGGPLVGRLPGGAEGPDGTGVVRLVRDELPTVPSGWLSLDAVDGPETGLDEATRSALGAWRRTSEGVARRLDPARWEPALEAFRASAVESRVGSVLPSDVLLVLGLVAGLQVALVAWIAWRRPRGAARLGALALPAVAALVWLVVTGHLTAGARAHVTALASDGVVTIVLRIEALRPVEVVLTPPSDARVPQPVRFDVDDRTWRDDEIGSTVRVRLEPGQSRVLAYLIEADVPADGGVQPPSAPLRAWLARLELRPSERTFRPPRRWLPGVEGATLVVGAARRVEAGK